MSTKCGKAFFFDFQSGDMSDLPPRDVVPQLPEALALKLNDTNRITTRAEIEANISKASKNREKILKEKVEKAKLHDEKIEKVKQLKRDMDENMTLLGNTMPSDQRILPSSPTLPKRLKQRLEILEQRIPPKTADMIRERENRALQNRNRILEEKREKARSTFPVRESVPQPVSAPSPPQFNAVELPKHLQDRLASLPPRRTTKQILDRYSTASKKKEGFLRTRQQKIREHLDRVELLRMLKANNSRIKLPKSLAKRLERISFKHTPEMIMARALKVEERRTSMLQARVLQSKEHWESVRRVSSIAKQLKEAAAEELARVQMIPSTTSPDLPKNLAERLNAYFSQKKTSKDIFDHFSQVTMNRMKVINERVLRAQKHMETVEYRRMVRMNLKKPKMTSRLRALLESRPKAKTPEQILARLEQASVRREEILKVKSLQGKKVVEHAFQVSHATKLMKQKLLKEKESAILSKAAPFLPKHLAEKLLLHPRPTEYEIRDRLDSADVRRTRILKERMKSCSKHADLVELRKMCRHNAKTAKLTPELAKRIAAFEAKKRCPAKCIDRERKTMERRLLVLTQVKQKALDHSEHVSTVISKAAANQQEMEKPVHKVEAAIELPESLAKRLESIHYTNKKEILDKESKAYVARNKHYAQVAAKAKAHGDKVAYRCMTKDNHKTTKLTKNLQALLSKRLESFPTPNAAQIRAKFERTEKNRVAQLKKVSQAAKKHNELVLARRTANNS